MAKLTVSQNRTERPVDGKIFGNFIESGFGRQVSGMWSEMLYNRAFRQVPEYKYATWEWLGLEKEYYNDNAPFWHSGYEEYDWKPVGEQKQVYTSGTHTFKGSTSLTIENLAPGQPCGLMQDGIHLQAGREYIFTLTAGIRGSLNAAGLNGFGTTVHTEEVMPVRVKISDQEHTFPLTTSVTKAEWRFTSVRTEIASISILFDFEGTAVLSCASLMPADHMGGWRKEVVERLREVAPGVVRFPGGCFVSFYNWESSIGDRDVREPQPSFYWGGLEENDVGLDEFMELAGLVGFEPQICFNMMTSQPFKARQMVEYLNAPADTGMGRLRMLNGHEKPYGVRLFEMDNEPDRKWTAEQYATQCVAFAREMRLADPTIELMMAAYTYVPRLLPRMLEIAGKDINYVIYRQGDPEFVHQILPMIREYNEKNGTNIRLVNTEWLPSCHTDEPFEDPQVPMNYRWRGKITNDYRDIFSTQQISWNYALNGAHRLLDYISYGGEFALANFNNMCNTWGQNVIEATKDTCYLSCMGKVFAFFHRVFVPCTASEVTCDDARIFALAVQETDGGQKLYLINHSAEAVDVTLPEGNWKSGCGLKGAARLYGEREDRTVANPWEISVTGESVTMEPLSILCVQ